MPKNTYKLKPKKRKKSFEFLKFTFLNDRKFHLTIGLLILVSSLFLLTAFISYLFTGQIDQSVINSIKDEGLKNSSSESENWLGLFGSISAHYFIFKYFGIASFLIPPFLFLIGFKIVFKKENLSISKSFIFTTFYLIWINLLMGYIMINPDKSNELGFLGGGIGYELAVFIDSFLGWGTVLILALSLIVFIIFFFDITNLINLENLSFFHFKTDNEKKYSPDSYEVESNKIADVIKQIKEEVEQEELEATKKNKTWEINPITKKKKTIEKPELDLNIEVPHVESKKLELEYNTPTQEKTISSSKNYDSTLDLSNYQYPSPDLLNNYPNKNVQVGKDELEQNKDKIIETLINFKIGISNIKATIGPTVTLYEIVPEAGIKISKIKNLENDIALNLAALGIRIIAPIPGKGTIGIEVPNKNREMVDVKSVLSTKKFIESDYDLPIVLGKTISNEVFVADLTRMPHLLMAGATGQGKSVGLNIILTSLIYKKHPSQLKFVLVDPKKVELTLFNKIEKHFLAMLPDNNEAIITDTKKVINTLNSLCIEMDDRYNMLKNAGCRNLKEYNQKFIERKLNPLHGHKFLPYIVLIIDELADLIMTAGKEVETPIARLAQLARAIGIHLVVATQRPSVNVITGIIKANFPARLSFRVTSKIDSRTILDAGGADQLVGMGDMLLSMGSEIIRLQCGFIDTPEVERLCNFVGNQQGYDTAYILPEYIGEDNESTRNKIDLADRDVLFKDAARLIVQHQQGSTSLIQRKLKLGYNRAGRIVDQLEAAGIVGAFEGSKAREVLVHDEHSLEQLLTNLPN